VRLESEVLAQIEDGKLSLGHARLLASLAPDRQRAFAKDAVREELSVRALERRIRALDKTPKPPTDATATRDPDIRRLGGDEFVIITGDNTGPDDIAVFVERIKHELRQPPIYRKEAVPIAFSVGHACYPIDGRSTMGLLNVADRRMYLEKQRHHERAATTG
jgi:GGDEF domain-containing protein